MKKKPAPQFHINPKFRAYGKARLEIAERAGSEEDWDRLWKKSANPFPFEWEGEWKHCIEYKVDDFAAEIGFLIDILGLPILALDSNYAMFTSPAGDFFFSVVPASDGETSTPPDAIRIQFMVADIQLTALELERRGIPFELWPQACEEGSSLFIGYFRTPHGICIDLWGKVESIPEKSDEERSGLHEDESEDIFSSLVPSLPEESDPGEVTTATDQRDYLDEATSTESEREEEQDETIHFSLMETQDEPNYQGLDSVEDAFPVEDDEQEEEVEELKYEYIDDDV